MVSQTKIELVQQLTDLINSHSVIAVVDFESLPAQQLQTMKAKLRAQNVTVVMARKRLLARALQESKQEKIAEMVEHLRGMPALLFANGNPFAVYATLQKSKSAAPARAGAIAPKDIVVPAGPTSFAPGPIISELAAVGVKTKVDGGKLAITDDFTVAKEGDEISQKLSEMLKRLDIKPMEIGLNLVAAWEGGFIFKAKDLRVDEEEYMDRFVTAIQYATNLSVEAVYPTTENAELLVQKAFRDAKGLAIEASVLSPEVITDIIARAHRAAQSVDSDAKL